MSQKINSIDANLLVRQGFPQTVVDGIGDLTGRQLELLTQISVGPKVGVKFRPKEWRQTILPLAMALIDRYRAKNVRLWYERADLNDHLGFDLDKGHYELTHYKIFDLAKNHNTEYFQQKNFHEADAVLVFFHDKRHQDWPMPLPQLGNLEVAKVLITSKQDQMQRFFDGFTSFCPPSIWNSAGTYYLGSTELKQIRWKLAITATKGDPVIWRVCRPGDQSVAQAEYFPTAMQYALQAWDWLGS